MIFDPLGFISIYLTLGGLFLCTQNSHSISTIDTQYLPLLQILTLGIWPIVAFVTFGEYGITRFNKSNGEEWDDAV